MTTRQGVRWQFEQVGLSYRLFSEDAGVELRVGRLKRSGQELQGELRIAVNWDGIKTVDGVLHQARFNLSSATTRSSLTKILKARTEKTAFEDMDWADALEHLCAYVLSAERQGEPLVSMDAPLPERRAKYDIKPMVPHGVVTWLYGPGGIGKSAFATALATSVAKGMEIIPGLAPQVKGPVMYCDYETDAYTVRERIEYLSNGHQFKPTKDFYYRRCQRPIADDAEELSRIVAEKGIKLVVVDSAGPALGTAGDRGDASDTTTRMFTALRLLGCTVIVIDHVSKSEMRNQKGEVVGALPYGSIYKINLARAAWELQNSTRPEDEDLHIRLVNTKANDSRLWTPIPFTIVWDTKQQVIMFTEGDPDRDATYYDHNAPPPPPAAVSPHRTQWDAVEAALAGRPDGLTSLELAIAAQCSQKRVNTVIAAHKERVEKIYGSNPPRYILTREGGVA